MAQPMEDVVGVINTLPELKTLVNDLLIVLTPKEKFIIEQRFSLNGNGRATLEKIGEKFQVTRERIRQIEKNALKKLQRNVGNTKLSALNAHARQLLEKHEGILADDKIVSEVLSLIADPSSVDVSSLKLSIELDPQIDYVRNTIHLRPYWKSTNVPLNLLAGLCEKIIGALKKEKDVVPLERVFDQLKGKMPQASKSFVGSAFDVDRRLKKTREGVGLTEWRHINPRTLRDKIHYVLRNQKKPLHYVEISNLITDSRFDHKTVNTQAVHNELIRHAQFVLIGRGIYALKEWGYEGGTVAQVISRILKKNGPMHRNDILKDVLRQRQVKKITVLLNLKNKQRFERVGRDKYKMK